MQLLGPGFRNLLPRRRRPAGTAGHLPLQAFRSERFLKSPLRFESDASGHPCRSHLHPRRACVPVRVGAHPCTSRPPGFFLANGLTAASPGTQHPDYLTQKIPFGILLMTEWYASAMQPHVPQFSNVRLRIGPKPILEAEYSLHSALIPVFRFLLRNVLHLGAIVLILVVGTMALDEWRKFPSARADLTTLRTSEADVRSFRDRTVELARARVERLRDGSIDALDRRIATIDSAVAATRTADRAPLLTLPLSSMNRVPRRVADHFIRLAAIEILTQERVYLLRIRSMAANRLLITTAAARLEELRRDHVALYADYLQAHARLAALNRDHPILSHAPFHLPGSDFARAEEAVDILSLKARAAALAFRVQADAVARIAPATPLAPFNLDMQRLDATAAPLMTALADARTVADGNWISRLLVPIGKAVPTAVGVVIAGFAGHLGIKALIFYWLAPLVTRAAPICLLPGVSGSLSSRHDRFSDVTEVPVESSASVVVPLAPHEVMLVLPEYVESSQVAGDKDTIGLHDWASPWTSLVSGMYALERIRPLDGQTITVSSDNDPLCEIACITVPAGSAIVFQPRGLVGVVHDRSTPLKITRHWRLSSLHAWLTLQLRFFVYAGPVTLLVKGNRGVRVERAGTGRTIRQVSTLGFSANVKYSTVRCETFFPFYMGRTALLQDRFAEDKGYYIYDETPVGSRRSGKAERGLEGLLDAMLKVFGV